MQWNQLRHYCAKKAVQQAAVAAAVQPPQPPSQDVTMAMPSTEEMATIWHLAIATPPPPPDLSRTSSVHQGDLARSTPPRPEEHVRSSGSDSDGDGDGGLISAFESWPSGVRAGHHEGQGLLPSARRAGRASSGYKGVYKMRNGIFWAWESQGRKTTGFLSAEEAALAFAQFKGGAVTRSVMRDPFA